jgi:bacterioferritin-associated ferredoxin
MIVCSCNLIRDTEIRHAARCGASCPRSAYAALGFEPQCCGCFDHAEDIIRDEHSRLSGAVRPIAA